MADINLLSETFALYFDKAKESFARGDKALAKKYYMLAAEQMLKMAKESKGELQKARFNRAKSIIEMADSIGVSRPAASANKHDSPVEAVKTEKISLEEALGRLNSLVGLSDVKVRVAEWVEQIKVFQTRKALGMKVPDMSYHLVFSGNPGTGKTTVARLMAQIYCALGILSEGQLVEVRRSDLVAGYVGQTALKTQDVIKKALGGVLFIDEAYTLAEGGSNDFGQEAIDTLLKEMEDRRDELVVIAAGYEKPIEKFISSNDGLRSRFKTFINFSDYNGRELYRIFLSLCEKNQYVLSEGAKEMLQTYFRQLYARRDKNFGNGRDVRNLFENVVTRQAQRVGRIQNATEDQLAEILPQDLPITLFDEPDAVEEPTVPVPPTPPTPPAPPAPPKGPEEKKDDAPPDAEKKVLEEGGGANTDFKFDWDSLPSINFDDIAGLDSVKEIVRVKVLLPLQHPEVFEGYVRKSGGGLLLYGPPGTGKTMIAAAIANEIGAKFCSVKPSDLLNQGAGNTEKAVRSLFAQARQFPCAVIYFDEMDSISPKSTKSQYAKQLRSEFLAQLQGIEEYGKKKDNILFLIAATNKPWEIDSAFVRPGRFGTRVYVGLPDGPAREYMISRRLEKIKEKGVVKVADDVDLAALVEATNGYNGADMTNFLDRAEEISALRGVQTGEKALTAADFAAALEQVSSSVQSEDIEKLLEWKGSNE